MVKRSTKRADEYLTADKRAAWGSCGSDATSDTVSLVGIPGCCNGVHHWYTVENGSAHNERAVSCRDYVAALEQMVRELGSDPQLALDSCCMAGERSELPATNAGIPVVFEIDAPTLSDPSVKVTVVVCSRCRRNPPRKDGPWCYSCYEKFVDQISGNGLDE